MANSVKTETPKTWFSGNEQDQLEKESGYSCCVYSIPTLIEHVSSIMKLEVGDVILTGTPKGVGPVHAGEVVTAGLRPGNQENDLVQLKFDVVDRKGGFVFKKE